MAKSLEDKLSWATESDSVVVDLARRDVEHVVSERYKGYIIRSRLKRVPNEAVKCNTLTCEKEVRRFSSRYIDSVKSPDGRVLESNRKMSDPFQVHFRDRFAPGSGVS